MALSDEFQARYSTARLVALTNPDAPSATTLDATRLAAACADAEAEFAAVCGATFDTTNAKHVAVAVLAVEWKLLTYTATKDQATATAESTFLAAANRYGLTGGGRGRIVPQTTSRLTPSQEVPDGVEIRPDFDRANLTGQNLRAPRAPARRGSSFREEE